MTQTWTGRTIGGRYQLDALIGAGGMSSVYRATDPNLRRVVAVKLIHPHLSINPDFVHRFKEEAAVVASLRHPNIVQVHDFNNEGDTYYMVMEYVAGETLQARLRRVNAAGRNLPIAEALNICRQVCDAAAYAHRHDLIHRDIKPANIMLDVNGQAILMDFGIVKIVGGTQHTATGATIGTAVYMSPEQIRSERVDERSDIYSLGVMLFEMLSGHPPFEADSALTLMMMHLNDPIPDPSTLRSEVPPALAAIVVKALAKNPRQRYQTATEMGDDLLKVQAALQTQPTETPTLIPTVVEPPTSPVGELAAPPAVLLATEAETPQPSDAAAKTEAEPPEEAVPGVSGPTLHEEAAPEMSALSLSEEAAPMPLMSETAAQPDIATPEPKTVQETPPTVPVTLIEGEAVPGMPSPTLAEAVVATPGGSEKAPIEEAEPAGETSSRQPETGPPPKGASRRWLRWLLLGIGLLVLAGLVYGGIWLSGQRRPPSEQFMPIERPVIPITLGNQSRLVNLGTWGIDASSRQLAFSPDSELLASANNRDWTRFSDYEYYAALWRAEPGELHAHLTGHTATIRSLDFSPDGSLLATTADDALINIWQVADGGQLRTIESSEGAINSIDFSPNGKLLAGAYWNGAALWQVSNGNLLRTYSTDEVNLRAIAFSPDGELLAGGSETGDIYIWQVGDGALLRTLSGHSEIISRLAFSPDGGQLTSASEDDTVKVWQSSDWTLLHNLTGHTEDVTDVAYSADGSLLASSSWDGSLRFWAAGDGQALNVYQVEGAVVALAFSSDGAWLATAEDYLTLHFWGVSEAISDAGLTPESTPQAEILPTPAAVSEANCHLEDVFCVGLVTDVGEVDDRGFNQAAWDAVQQAQNDGIADFIKFIETKDPKDYELNIDFFANAGYDVIVSSGFALGPATRTAAEKYPEIMFIGTDQLQAEVLPNLAGLVFAEERAGFLAGALAAMMSQSGKIAGVYGTDLIPPVVAFKVGFENGARSINPKIEVISTFHPGGLEAAFEDPEWGAATARQAIDQGADVIFGAGGKTGNGALIETAATPGRLCIGVDLDQWETLPEAHPCLISSAMKLVYPGVYDLIRAAKDGAFLGGNVSAPVGLAPFHEFESSIPQEVKDRLEEIAKDQQGGIPNDREEEMVLIPGGEFQMGSVNTESDEQPVVTVAVEPFSMDIYEVTKSAFADFLNDQGNQAEGGVTWLSLDMSGVYQSEDVWQAESGYEYHPVTGVTWYGARAFCAWREARLPTEAEWEWAARGGLKGMPYPWGEDMPVCEQEINGAQFADCGGFTVEAGNYAANGFGLYDMAGNVGEWTSSLYQPYPYNPDDGREDPLSTEGRVQRGGSWYHPAAQLRVSYRDSNLPAGTFGNIGFRCVRSP